MPHELPAPPVPFDVDLRGYSSFMLDVDRFLASELAALATPEEGWAALFLWCRAWKQSPPGSLPDDDRVLASFSNTGKRWGKVRVMALRGFVRCSDGRLYHRVLCDEVATAWKRRQEHDRKRDKDSKRLQEWRDKQDAKRVSDDDGNAVETRFNAPTTRVSSLRDRTGQDHTGQDRTGQDLSSKAESKATAKASRTKRAPELPLPLNFAISDRVRQWAIEKGFDRIELRFEHFVGKARAKGYTYADWDEGFMGSIRDNWLKLPPANGALSAAGQQTAANLNEWVQEAEARDATR